VNDDPGIEPVDLSPTRDELIARVRARGRRIRARRRLTMSGLAALVIVAIAVPAIAIGSRSSSHVIRPGVTTTGGHGDLRVARVVRLQRHGEPCVKSFDGKYCYVLGQTVMTASDVVKDRVGDDPSQGWIVLITVTRDAIRRLNTLVNEQAAFVVGGRVISAPTVNPGITGTTIEISGHLSHAQATRIAAEIVSGPTPPTESVTASIELPGDLTYVAGSTVQGTLVVHNGTNEWWTAPQASGCPVPWAVELTKPGSTTVVPAFEGCVQVLRSYGPGVDVRLPFVLRTTADGCAGVPVAASCDPGPPLTPGRYTAVLVTAGPGWPTPHGVVVTLVPAQVLF
jgi:hypothetical protein